MKKYFIAISLVFMFVSTPNLKALGIIDGIDKVVSNFTDKITGKIAEFGGGMTKLLSGISSDMGIGSFDGVFALPDGLQKAIGSNIQCKLEMGSILGKASDIGSFLDCSKANFGLPSLNVGELFDLSKIGGGLLSCKSSVKKIDITNGINKMMQGMCNSIRESGMAAFANIFLKGNGGNDEQETSLNEIFSIKYKSDKRISLLNTMNAKAHEFKQGESVYTSKAVFLISHCFAEARRSSDPAVAKKKLEICNDPTNYYFETYKDYLVQRDAIIKLSEEPAVGAYQATPVNSSGADLANMADFAIQKEQELKDFPVEDYVRDVEIAYNRKYFKNVFLNMETVFKTRAEALAWNVSDYDKMIYATKIMVQLYKDAELKIDLMKVKKVEVKKALDKINDENKKAAGSENLHKYYEQLAKDAGLKK